MDERDIRFYGSATVGPRGQVTVPATLRRELGLHPGDQVLFIREGDDPAGFQVCLPEHALRGVRPARGWRPGETPFPPKQAGSAEADRKIEHVRRIDLFRNLDPAVQRHVAGLLQEERYRRGQVIALEGEECKALYCLVSGRAKRFKTSPDGKEQIIKVLVAGDTFNEVPVLDGGPNPASTAALEDCVVYALNRADFLQAIEQVPGLATGLIQVLSSRLRHLVDLVEDLSLRNVMARLAALLLEQAEVVNRLTQQEIGAMIGATRESVGRALHSLETAGAITITGGRITIRDRQILQQCR